MLIVTREEAVARGLSRYFTGKPCKSGHVAERVTKTRACVECHREAGARTYAKRAAADPQWKAKRVENLKTWKRDNPERARDAARQANRLWREHNKEKIKDDHKRWRDANPEKVRASSARQRAADPQAAREAVRRSAAKHPETARAYRQGRRQGDGRRVPELDAARANGDHTYFTGKPCRNGHVCERYTSDKKCRLCTVERSARQRANDPEAHREGSRRWAREHPQEVKANQRRWIDENRDRHNANLRAWREANPERFREIRRSINNRRRAQKAAVNGSFSADDIVSLHQHQGGRCAQCKKRRKLEIDHIMPLAKGGTNDIGNIQLLCGPCNRTKGARDPIEWAQSKGRLL